MIQYMCICKVVFYHSEKNSIKCLFCREFFIDFFLEIILYHVSLYIFDFSRFWFFWAAQQIVSLSTHFIFWKLFFSRKWSSFSGKKDFLENEMTKNTPFSGRYKHFSRKKFQKMSFFHFQDTFSGVIKNDLIYILGI